MVHYHNQIKREREQLREAQETKTFFFWENLARRHSGDNREDHQILCKKKVKVEAN